MEQIQAFIRLQPMHVKTPKPEDWDSLSSADKAGYIIDLFRDDIDQLLEVNIHVPPTS